MGLHPSVALGSARPYLLSATTTAVWAAATPIAATWIRSSYASPDHLNGRIANDAFLQVQGGHPLQGQQGASPLGQQAGAAPTPVGNVGRYKQLLDGCIKEKRLQKFYPPGSTQLDQIAEKAGAQVAALAAEWRISTEIASDVVKLALYDVILYIDDSGSMAFEENGERIDDLKLILNRVAFATALFDDDGIQVRFMNSLVQGNGINSAEQANQMIANNKFSGLTPMGRELQNKILGPLVLGPARSGQLYKPVLVITITDGQPTGESPSDVAQIMKNASASLEQLGFGMGALAFQFAQVGNDLKAREFLSKLDEEPAIGDIIDCTSSKCKFVTPLDSVLTGFETTKLKLTKCPAPTHLST